MQESKDFAQVTCVMTRSVFHSMGKTYNLSLAVRREFSAKRILMHRKGMDDDVYTCREMRIFKHAGFETNGITQCIDHYIWQLSQRQQSDFLDFILHWRCSKYHVKTNTTHRIHHAIAIPHSVDTNHEHPNIIPEYIHMFTMKYEASSLTTHADTRYLVNDAVKMNSAACLQCRPVDTCTRSVLNVRAIQTQLSIIFSDVPPGF